MKLQSIKYLTREGLRNVWVNRLMSIASVGVLMACMVLIGFAILLTQNANVYMSNLEQENVVLAYFNDENSVIYQEVPASEDNSSSEEEASSTESDSKEDAETPVIDENKYLIHNEEEAKAVCKKLEKLNNVKAVEFISADQALENAKEVMPDMAGAFEILDEDNGNPMSHGARITLISMDKFDQTISAIEATEGVYNVVSHGDLAKKIADIKEAITVICFWIIGILGVIALVIVSNTIRVTMYNRKLEISIMKAVGATDAFIRLPFIIEGVILGITSAIISEGILYFCYRVASESMGETFKLPVTFSSQALLLFGIFALIGIIAGALGSAFMITKYLKKEGSEFKAL